jgi:hypothetical protein
VTSRSGAPTGGSRPCRRHRPRCRAMWPSWPTRPMTGRLGRWPRSSGAWRRSASATRPRATPTRPPTQVCAPRCKASAAHSGSLSARRRAFLPRTCEPWQPSWVTGHSTSGTGPSCCRASPAGSAAPSYPALTSPTSTITPPGCSSTCARPKPTRNKRGRRIEIVCGDNPATCPVRAARAWLEVAGLAEGPLLQPVDRHGNIATPAAVAPGHRSGRQAPHGPAGLRHPGLRRPQPAPRHGHHRQPHRRHRTHHHAHHRLHGHRHPQGLHRRRRRVHRPGLRLPRPVGGVGCSASSTRRHSSSVAASATGASRASCWVTRPRRAPRWRR